MKSLFSQDNPLIRFLTLLCNLMLVNLCFLLTCVPIFTIGAAISAAYAAIFAILREKDPSVVAVYLRALRKNFKSATLLWLPLLTLLAFFAADLYVIYVVIDPQYRLLQIPVWIFVFCLLSVMIYAFPLLARYDTTGKQLIQNALLLSLANVPTTIFVVVLHGVVFWVAGTSLLNLAVVVTLGVFFGCAALLAICGFFLLRVFERTEAAQKQD